MVNSSMRSKNMGDSFFFFSEVFQIAGREEKKGNKLYVFS